MYYCFSNSVLSSAWKVEIIEDEDSVGREDKE